MADASMGYKAQLAADAAGTAVGSFTEPYEVVRESLRKSGRILDTAGIRGTRSHTSERTRAGTYDVGGSLVMHATPAMLDKWLPRILGAAESADTFALAETLPEFAVLIDRVARRFVYDGCKVNRATFRAAAGQLVTLELDILGKSEAVSATAFPSLTMPTDAPYVMQDGVLTLQSAARKFTEFEVIVDNVLARRFSNSQTATDISPGDRIVTFRCQTPFTSDEVDLYNQALAGAAATLVFTNGGYSTTFSFATLQFADLSPTVAGKSEIFLELTGIARKSGSTSELVVTHDSTA
jgi:hypothetical protein